MEDFIFSANVILPLLVLMSVGYLCKQVKLVNATTVSQANSMVFKVFLPTLLFNNIRVCSVEKLMNLNLFVYVLIGVLILFALVTFIILPIEKDNAKRGVMIQGICRSNYALFGIPLITLLFPNEDIAVASLLIAVVIPVFNVSSVIILMIFGSKDVNFGKIFLGICKNPLIIGTVLGIIFLTFKIQMPEFLDTSVNNISAVASPFALVLLGAGFEFKNVKEHKNQLLLVTLGRLIIVPVTMVTIAYFLGFRGVELGCAMVVFSAPTAVSSYTMAEKMGGDAPLASSIVVLTSTFAIISMFLLIYSLRLIGLI